MPHPPRQCSHEHQNRRQCAFGQIAELDRKLDDGLAETATYRIAPAWDNATATATPDRWRSTTLAYAAAADVTCGAAASSVAAVLRNNHEPGAQAKL